jgi:hypothetical protein
MCDLVAEFADTIEASLNIDTLDGPTRKDFDRVVTPEHVVFRPCQSGIETLASASI